MTDNKKTEAILIYEDILKNLEILLTDSDPETENRKNIIELYRISKDRLESLESSEDIGQKIYFDIHQRSLDLSYYFQDNHLSLLINKLDFDNLLTYLKNKGVLIYTEKNYIVLLLLNGIRLDTYISDISRYTIINKL